MCFQAYHELGFISGSAKCVSDRAQRIAVGPVVVIGIIVAEGRLVAAVRELADAEHLFRE